MKRLCLNFRTFFNKINLPLVPLSPNLVEVPVESASCLHVCFQVKNKAVACVCLSASVALRVHGSVAGVRARAL